MQCTALVHVPRPIRRYHCNDPECARYPKGHRHAVTCNTTTPRGFMYGQTLSALGAAMYNLGVATRQLKALGCPGMAANAAYLRGVSLALLDEVRAAGLLPAPVSHETRRADSTDAVQFPITATSGATAPKG